MYKIILKHKRKNFKTESFEFSIDGQEIRLIDYKISDAKMGPRIIDLKMYIGPGSVIDICVDDSNNDPKKESNP